MRFESDIYVSAAEAPSTVVRAAVGIRARNTTFDYKKAIISIMVLNHDSGYLLDKLCSHLGPHIGHKPMQPEPKGKLVFSCSLIGNGLYCDSNLQTDF